MYIQKNDVVLSWSLKIFNPCSETPYDEALGKSSLENWCTSLVFLANMMFKPFVCCKDTLFRILELSHASSSFSYVLLIYIKHNTLKPCAKKNYLSSRSLVTLGWSLDQTLAILCGLLWWYVLHIQRILDTDFSALVTSMFFSMNLVHPSTRIKNNPKNPRNLLMVDHHYMGLSINGLPQ